MKLVRKELFVAAVKEGLSEMRAGHVLEHEAVVRHFEKRLKKNRRR